MTGKETLPYDGEPPKWTSTDRLSALLGPRYEVTQRLGEGAMGTVVLARDTTLDRPVAIKLSKPGSEIERQEREAQTLAQIVSPYVVGVYDFQRLSEDETCVIMQYVEGGDLDAILRQGQPIETDRVNGWMTQVAIGMAATEKAQVVHRDLKPANILIDSDGDAHVTDFGLAFSPSRSRLTMSGNLLGTPLYIAPEQVEDVSGVDTRTDIYSYGATFYHAITGQPPFHSDSLWDLLLKHKIEPLEPPISRNANVPQHLNDCIERCLAKRPADRFQTFGEVRQQLEGGASRSPWDQQVDSHQQPNVDRYKLNRDALLDGSATGEARKLVFELSERTKLTLQLGNLTDQNVDALVSSDDGYLSMGGGVSAALHRAAGKQLTAETQHLPPARQGRVVVTGAGKLFAKFIFHGITIGVGESRLQRPSRDIVAEIIDACLYHAETFSIRSIAFPLLGSGAGLLDPVISLDTIFYTLLRRLSRRATPLEDIRIVLYA